MKKLIIERGRKKGRREGLIAGEGRGGRVLISGTKV